MVEHPILTRKGAGSSPVGPIDSRGPAATMPGFDPGDAGANPVGSIHARLLAAKAAWF